MAAFVYRDYSQSELDFQYDTHRLVPTVAAYKNRWATISTQVRRERKDCVIDISYGNDTLERLDLFPPQLGPGPVEIFFHGGYWSRSDKLYYSFVGDALARQGALAVLINYPLCPAVDMERLIVSCRKAVVWAYHNADGFGGDSSRIFVSGYSAGGHIAAMLALTDWVQECGLPADVLKGVAAVSGLYDLEPVTLSSSNSAIKLTKRDVERFSPTTLPVGHYKPCFVVAGGGLESAEFKRQSEEYAQHIRNEGAMCEHIVVPGHHHYSVLDAFCNLKHLLGSAVLRQLGLS